MRKTSACVEKQPALSELYIAANWWQRLRGLLGRPPLTSNQGLLIDKCNSVHMVGMKYSIDVIYLNYENQVIKVREGLRPWQFSACRKAKRVIEVLAGEANRKNIEVGKIVSWSKV